MQRSSTPASFLCVISRQSRLLFGSPCRVEALVVHAGELPLCHPLEACQSRLLFGSPCRVEALVVHAGELPLCHPPEAGQSRLLYGSPCRVEALVVHACELPVCNPPAACRSQLPVGSPCSVEVVHASELPVHCPTTAGWILLLAGRALCLPFASPRARRLSLQMRACSQGELCKYLRLPACAATNVPAV